MSFIYVSHVLWLLKAKKKKTYIYMISSSLFFVVLFFSFIKFQSYREVQYEAAYTCILVYTSKPNETKKGVNRMLSCFHTIFFLLLFSLFFLFCFRQPDKFYISVCKCVCKWLCMCIFFIF